MVFDGERIAYRIDGEFWAHEHDKFQHQRYASASDGKTSKIYWPADTRYPRGFEDSASKNPDLTSYHIKPLLMSYRILDSKMKGLSADRLTLSSASGLVDDRECSRVSWKLSLRPDTAWLRPYLGRSQTRLFGGALYPEWRWQDCASDRLPP